MQDWKNVENENDSDEGRVGDDKFTLEILSERWLGDIKTAHEFMVQKTNGLEREIWEPSGEVTTSMGQMRRASGV